MSETDDAPPAEERPKNSAEERPKNSAEERPKNSAEDSKEKSSGDKDKKDSKDDDKPHSKLPLIIGGVVLLVAIIAFIIYYIATAGKVSTDDAYTDGRSISIASNVSGYVTQLDITDNSYVHAGQLLLEIDPRANLAGLQQAQANLVLAKSQLAAAQVNMVETKVKAPAQLRQAQAQLAQARAQEVLTARNYRRQIDANRLATAGTDIDQASEQLKSAQASVAQAQAQVATASLIPQQLQTAQVQVREQQAQLAQAQANLAQAQVKLSYNDITAPQDGWITMRNVDLGTYVQAGQQMFYIVSPHFWVTANFKETELAQIKPGDHVKMTLDAYSKIILYGHVDSIQQGSGAQFSAFPAENATGNFVKIVRRVPVKIVIDNTRPARIDGLPLGISVEPTVTLK